MSIFERLWKNTMDIYRWTETEVDGVTKDTEGLVLPSDIKCHYSKGSLTETGDDGIPTLISSHMLFCSIGTVRSGDKVIVTQRNGDKVTLTVGEGFPYSDAMQYRVKRSDTA